MTIPIFFILDVDLDKKERLILPWFYYPSKDSALVFFILSHFFLHRRSWILPLLQKLLFPKVVSCKSLFIALYGLTLRVLFQVEEKMRTAHERKSQKLKRLDERGAEAHKVDTTRSMIRSLSTKIRIAIQVVEKISLKINKLRDDELWPQLNELIQGYAILMSSLVAFFSSICLPVALIKKIVYLQLLFVTYICFLAKKKRRRNISCFYTHFRTCGGSQLLKVEMCMVWLTEPLH